MIMHKREKLSRAEGQAFMEALYRSQYEILMSYVQRQVQSRMLAEDIVQDTFCEAVRNVDKLYPHPNRGGWLMETAKNKIREARRRISRESPCDPEDFLPELLRIEERYSIAELNTILEEVFNEQERRLFHMYYILGYTAKELAQIENITENNLKVRMYRLRKRLLERVGV